MTITASLDMSKMLAVIRQFPGQTVTTQDDFLKEQCRLLISTSGRGQRGIVQVTPPFNQGAFLMDGTKKKSSGKGNDAKQTGINSVNRDLARVYANPGVVHAALKAIDKGAAAGYWKARIAKDFKRMQTIAESVKGLPAFMLKMQSFDGGTEHQSRRGRNGRVVGRTPSMIVSDPSSLAKYRKRKERNVGMFASMIPAAAGSKLGAIRGIPAWVKRHNAAGGYITPRKTSKGNAIIIGLTKSYVSDMQRRMSYVLGYRVKALGKQLPYIAKRLEKKLQAQLNAA